MLNKVGFPLQNNQRYYSVHYKYLLNILEYMEVEIVFLRLPEINPTSFVCIMNDREVVIDFSDDGNSVDEFKGYPIFKFHYKKEHEDLMNVFPLPPVSFYNWSEQKRLEKQIEYTAEETILYIQRPYGDATIRRNKMLKALEYAYKRVKFLDTEFTNQEDYWRKINNCLCHVFVGGRNNNILDRAHLQYLSFGACTISTHLPEIFPYKAQLVPGLHYLLIHDDFSNVIEIIEWCRRNRKQCITIGKRAKKFFNNTCKPEVLIEWMSEVLGI